MIYACIFLSLQTDVTLSTGWESPRLEFVNGTTTKSLTTNGNSPSAAGLSKISLRMYSSEISVSLKSRSEIISKECNTSEKY